MRPLENLTLDVAAFYFDYDDLISIVPVSAAPPTVRFRNQAEAQNAGVEVAAAWQPIDRWRLHASYSYLHVETSNEGINQLGDRDPDHMFQVRSYLDVTEDVELNTALYWVDKVRRFDISSYVRLDAGITWRPRERVSLSLWGQNLTEHDHPESQAASTNEALAEIRRGVYGRVELRF